MRRGPDEDDRARRALKPRAPALKEFGVGNHPGCAALLDAPCAGAGTRHANGQLPHVDRLDEVVVSAKREPREPLVHAPPGRQKDHRNPRELRIHFDSVAQRESVVTGQADIDENRGRFDGAGGLDSLFARPRRNGVVPGVSQVARYDGALIVVVFHNQDR